MMNKILPYFLIAVVFTFLGGCVPHNLPTPSPFPATATITWIPTRTPSATPTITYSPLPTLSPEDAYARINELLNSNSNCLLPCWMGIMPGQSTWQDVYEQLTIFSGIARRLYIETGADEWSTGFLTIPYLHDNMMIEVSPYYLTSSSGNIISVIAIETRTYKLNNGEYDGDVYGYPAYNELLKPYTISEVLSSYGQPDQIYISASLRGDTLVTPGYGDFFEIHLWYPEQGIFMKYVMSVEGSGDNYRFCPSNAFILGYLLPPGLDPGYQEILIEIDDRYQNWFPPSDFIKTPEDAFGMTNEEFYHLIITSPDSCLETLKAIWWP